MKENFFEKQWKIVVKLFNNFIFFGNYSYLRNEQNILELTFFKQKKEHSHSNNNSTISSSIKNKQKKSWFEFPATTILPS